MSVIDVVIPTYRGLEPEANSALIAMQQASNCFCRDERTGTPLHLPWKCPKGKHSVRMMPPVSSSSVVHWARNQVVAQSLYGQPKGDNRPPAEYLFLMDDDMLALPHYLTRLVSYKADIVCGICTIRRDPPVPNIRFWFPKEASFRPPIEWDWDSNKLMEIDGAGAAFMLVKRTVFERIGQAYLDCAFELDEDLRKLDGLREKQPSGTIGPGSRSSDTNDSKRRLSKVTGPRQTAGGSIFRRTLWTSRLASSEKTYRFAGRRRRWASRFTPTHKFYLDTSGSMAIRLRITKPTSKSRRRWATHRHSRTIRQRL